MFNIRKNNHFYEKVGKNEPVCIDDKIPFEIPDSWEWCKHPFLFEISGGSQPAKSKFSDEPKEDYIRLYQIRDYGPKPVPVYIPIESAKKISKKGDIMLARYGGSLGKVFWAEDGAYNVAIAKVILLFDEELIDKEFLFLFYLSDLYQSFVKSRSSGRSAQAGFNKNDLNTLLFPLPPLNEQKRIVYKFKQIEPYFDKYEVSEEELTKLNNEFPVKIKDSILQAAIQGKLVPQDPNDEPASVLLGRIKEEKEQLIKAKKIKRNKNESVIFKENNHFYEKIKNNKYICIDEEIPFKIPKTWEWCRLEQICNYGHVKSIDSKDIREKDWVLDLKDIEKGTGKLLNFTTKNEINSKSKKNCFYKNDVLYCKLRPYLNKVIIAFQNGFCTSEILPLNFGKYILPKYAQLVLMSPYFVDYANKCSYGTKMPRLGTNDGKKALFPLPPIKEQKRIVKKLITLYEELNI